MMTHVSKQSTRPSFLSAISGRWLAFLVAIFLPVLISAGCNSGEAESPSPVTIRTAQDKIAQNRYIVVLEPGTDSGQAAADLTSQFGGKADLVYSHALRGFAVTANPQAIEGMRNAPAVRYIEQDRIATAFEQTLPTGIDRVEADANDTAQIDGSDERVEADVAVIDTGVDLDHPDLNVHQSIDCTGGGRFNAKCESGGDDGNGHGTHVAGTAGALDNTTGVVGMAPGTRIWAVKVLKDDGSGFLSYIIAGIDYVTQHADQIEVANMSLGWSGNSSSARESIQNSTQAGVLYTVAAGNDDVDVYGDDETLGTSDDVEPASYPEVATVSAFSDTDGEPGGNGPLSSFGGEDQDGDGVDDGEDDSFAFFSNFSNAVTSDNPVSSSGNAIDLLLPGVDIESTYLDGGYDTLSGTSMASPHGAGLAALYIAANRNVDVDGDGTNDKFDTNGDGVVDQNDVYEIRQDLIDNGVSQDSADGLEFFNDPDGNFEVIGWAQTGPSASVSIDPSSQSGEAFPGNTVSYDYTITNTGDVNDTYSLSTSSTWSSSVDTTSLSLNAGESATVTVSHDVPDSASAGESDTGVLSVQSDNTTASSEAEFTTTAKGFSVVIDPDSQSSSGAPGTTVTYTYTVTNDGTEDDSYSLSITDASWSTTLSDSGLTLAAGESQDIQVDHHIPKDASDGDSDTGTVTVSSDNSDASDSSTFTTTASEGLSVSSITPNEMDAGTTVDVTVEGSGFETGADLTFENGDGPNPEASDIVVVDSQTLEATVSAKSGGPNRQRVFDVVVTNSDGTSARLHDGFTVNP